ncbi:hypothetical protein IWQ60_005319 [Tieghemiomyces parasiticus]|uniref:Uncharacterized protein n=1 Tax=Tieghemiomyces parasiticus TaxID=78921 RepID=A0A9W8AET9_9FUNG|nr:hypothetical protein IWQ60_005319 [Tieghemiomyces parasiticus]
MAVSSGRQSFESSSLSTPRLDFGGIQSYGPGDATLGDGDEKPNGKNNVIEEAMELIGKRLTAYVEPNDEGKDNFPFWDFKETFLPIIKEYIVRWFVRDVLVCTLRDNGYYRDLEKMWRLSEQLAAGYSAEFTFPQRTEYLFEDIIAFNWKTLRSYLPVTPIKKMSKFKPALEFLSHLPIKRSQMDAREQRGSDAVFYFAYLVEVQNDKQLAGLLKYIKGSALKSALEAIPLDSLVDKRLLDLAKDMIQFGGLKMLQKNPDATPEEQIRWKVVHDLPESLVAAILTLRLSKKEEIDPDLQALFQDTAVISNSNNNLGWAMAAELGYKDAIGMFPAELRRIPKKLSNRPMKLEEIRDNNWRTRLTCSVAHRWENAAEAAHWPLIRISNGIVGDILLDTKCHGSMRDISPIRLASNGVVVDSLPDLTGFQYSPITPIWSQIKAKLHEPLQSRR